MSDLMEKLAIAHRANIRMGQKIAALVEAARAALARIESDIETDRQKTPEGDRLRELLAEFYPWQNADLKGP